MFSKAPTDADQRNACADKIAPELTLAKKAFPRLRYALDIEPDADLLPVHRRLSPASIRLGLLALLLIHVGPLYSAWQLAQTGTPQVHSQYVDTAAGELDSPAHSAHHQAMAGQPRWLTALNMCGYCDLLTLSPPLTLFAALVLPRYRPAKAHPLPDMPMPPAWRHGTHHPRAPPGPISI